MDYKTLIVRFDDDLCFIQLNRPEANNTINELLINEFQQVVNLCYEKAKIIIIEGLPEVFCFGADFQTLAREVSGSNPVPQSPEPLYDLWYQLATGPFFTISHVRGKANAGGVGFVAASDLVISDEDAEFSLSELLFGLMPACVMPFLIRRMGFQKAHAMTLMTKPVKAESAEQWGLVDVCADNSKNALRQNLLRLRRLNKTAITRYKNYLNRLDDSLSKAKPLALEANLEVFSDQENIAKITRYVETGQFPWEK